jgi:hypothetical protein
MEFCKKCCFYSSAYDELRRNFDDMQDSTIAYTEKHYCPMYNDHIPVGVLIGVSECKEFIEKDD